MEKNSSSGTYVCRNEKCSYYFRGDLERKQNKTLIKNGETAFILTLEDYKEIKRIREANEFWTFNDIYKRNNYGYSSHQSLGMAYKNIKKNYFKLKFIKME
ncbi:MAG: hypothetical protein LBT10_09635 [Methanobrevibacter sp.]|jgi:hypothetical protein|nr:hypothetical protein [Methanobrevibacter sp.]